MATNQVLRALGIDNSVFYFGNTVLLYNKGRNSPFGMVEQRGGNTVLRVGGLLEERGHRVVIP